jgi:membrane fusion protein (multidrug efflux system)
MADERKDTGAQAPAGKGRRGRKRIIIPVLLLVIVAALAAVYWHVNLRGYVSTDDAYIDGDAVTVSSKMMGRLDTLNAGAGDSVGQGQLLAKLEDTDLRAQEAQAMAGLEYVRRSVPVAKIGLDRAREDFDRASFQYKNKVVAREQYDHARKALEMAEAQYEQTLSQVNASKAQLDVVQAQLDNTRILAPLSGIVAKKWAMPGDVVQPGQPILTLYDLENLWVTANIEETKLRDIKTGAEVRIRVDAYRGREFTGRVELIGAAAASRFSLIPPNNASGNFTKVTQRIPVKISIESHGAGFGEELARLLPGMSVEVKIRAKGH